MAQVTFAKVIIPCVSRLAVNLGYTLIFHPYGS